MRIVVDVDLDQNGNVIAQHVIHTDNAPWNLVQHPVTPNTMMSVLQFLAFMQLNRTQLDVSGWSVPTKIKGFLPGTTRWQVLVLAAQAVTADPLLKALNLT